MPKPIKELFRGLIERGLYIEDGLLCVVDGGKGLWKAIGGTFGAFAQVQRCQMLGAGERRELPAEGRPTEVAKEAPARL